MPHPERTLVDSEPGHRSKKYWAFISYSSKDRKWGQWLHKRLESYPVPREFQGSALFDGAVLGKNLRPIFRDRDELAGSSELGPAILRALDQSRFLVVLCSKNSAKSMWVNKEIENFKSIGGERFILALILDGEPNATSDPTLSDEEECFPPALRYPAEPLAGDLRKNGDGKERGFLKVLAGIAQLDFDALYRRHERAQRQKRLAWTGVAASVILVLTGLTAFAFSQKKMAEEQRRIATVRHAETLYREGLSSLNRGESFKALSHFLDALDERPDWKAPLVHVTELLARSYWPVMEQSIALIESEDDDYFLRQMKGSLLMAPNGPLLLGSNVGIRAVDLTNGTTEFLSHDEVAARLEGGPFVGLDSHFEKVEYRWGELVAFGFDQDLKPFLYLIDEKRLIMGDAPEDAGFDSPLIGYSANTNLLKIAILNRSESYISVESFRDGGDRLVLEERSKIPLPDLPEDAEVYLRGFDISGTRVFLSSSNDSWILGGAEHVHLPIPRVERVAFSPSGNRVAILRSNHLALHGENNLLLSILSLDDFDSFSRFPKSLHVPHGGKRFEAVTRSEEVPLRNPLMGYSGKWYEQGYCDAYFLSEDRVLIISGNRCHLFRVWDRRALPMPYMIATGHTEDDVQSFPAAEGVELREDGLVLSHEGKSHVIREEFPITEAIWLGDSNMVASAASYKFYGESVSVWDAETGTRIIGPLGGRELSPDSSADTLSVSLYGSPHGFIGYSREIITPAHFSQWLMDLGKAVVNHDFNSIPGPQMVPASISVREKELVERLLWTGSTEDLRIQVGSDITRKAWRDIHLPQLMSEIAGEEID